MSDGKDITSPAAGPETRGGERPDEWRGPLPAVPAPREPLHLEEGDDDAS